MEFIQSVCPGCCINCGLYIVRSGEGIKVDYRKRSPVNEEKLCKFGVDLARYYQKERPEPTVDGKEVDLETAIGEAAERLKMASSAETGFLCMGNSTNEEILAFKRLADSFGIENIDCTLSKHIISTPEDLKPALSVGVPFKSIEEADRIILISINPSLQYPLLLRRVIHAEKKGAEVVMLNPAESESLELEGAVVISEITQKTDPMLIKMILEAGKDARSICFMKPHANLTGAMLLGFYGVDISEKVKLGEIRSLFLLDPVPGDMDDLLSDLDLLIVQAGMKTRVSEVADITIPSPRFFEREGTVVNIEGRVLPVGGTSRAGVESLLKIMGGEMDFEDVRRGVWEVLGVDGANEDLIAITQGRR